MLQTVREVAMDNQERLPSKTRLINWADSSIKDLFLIS